MTWSNYYVAPVDTPWHGRKHIPMQSCFFQIIRLLDISKTIPQTSQLAKFALIGFCSNEGIRRNQGRIGAMQGPNAIREVLAKIPVPNPDIIFYDAGDVTCIDGNLEEAQIVLGNAITMLLHQGITPLVLGGGHELAYGHYLGIAQVFSDQKLGIINFDAHFDMRPLPEDKKGNSGTPFLQIANLHKNAHRHFDYNCIGIQPTGNIQKLFNIAKDWHSRFLLAEELHCNDKEKSIQFINRLLQDNQIIYQSLCLDVFSAAYAPGVSAPQVFGLTPWQVIPLIRQLTASGKVISYDIAELSPTYDIDHRTAKLAASFIYEIIRHHKGDHHASNLPSP